jgi:hypothetical protein
MKLSGTEITLRDYDFSQHKSREKLCAKRLHEINSKPDFSIPILGLEAFAVAAFIGAGIGARCTAGQAPLFS